MSTVYEDIARRAGFAFLCSNFGKVVDAARVTDTDTVGTLVRVAPGCCLSTFNVICPGWGTNVGHMDFGIYRWNGAYAASVSAKPVFRETVTDYFDNARVTFHIPLDLIGAGEWLCLFENGSEDAVGIYLCEPSDEAYAAVAYAQGFRNGQPVAAAPRGYVTYTTDMQVVKPDLPLTRLTPAKRTSFSCRVSPKLPDRPSTAFTVNTPPPPSMPRMKRVSITSSSTTPLTAAVMSRTASCPSPSDRAATRAGSAPRWVSPII